LYDGGFKDYRDAKLRKDAAEQALAVERAREQERGGRKAKAQKPSSPPPKAQPGQAGSAHKDEARELARKRKQVQDLELAIQKGEEQLESYRKALREAEGGNWAELHELSNKERSLASEMERRMMQWATLSEALARAAARGA
jgi:hypothetical protein